MYWKTESIKVHSNQSQVILINTADRNELISRVEANQLSIRKREYDDYFAKKRGIRALNHPTINIESLIIPSSKRIDLDAFFNYVISFNSVRCECSL